MNGIQMVLKSALPFYDVRIGAWMCKIKIYGLGLQVHISVVREWADQVGGGGGWWPSMY